MDELRERFGFKLLPVWQTRVKVGVFLLLISVLPLTAEGTDASPQKNHPVEFEFFRRSFDKANGARHSNQLNAAFVEVVKFTARANACGAKVTLGGMLALVLYESAAKIAFYNTRDAENSFKDRLDQERPFSQQPFAKYSYQFGIIPIHTSNLRPCKAGSQSNRQLLDKLVAASGFRATARDIESIRSDFAVVCNEAKTDKVRDYPRSVDFYILRSHEVFGVPPNGRGSDSKNLAKFPLYQPEITAPIFFTGMERACGNLKDDRAAICAWGGGDASYCDKSRQGDILGPWLTFSGRR